MPVLVFLAVVPQLWQENSPCFCRVQRILTYCLHIIAELIVSAINNLKTMGGGHTVHERQTILSTMVVISHTFCMAKENKLTPRGEGCGSNHVIL